MLQMPGSKRAVFQLGHCGYITYIEVDTYHFKGNYYDSIHIEGTTEKPGTDWGQATWYTLLPPQKVCHNSMDKTGCPQVAHFRGYRYHQLEEATML
jgi:allantoicase